MNLQWTGQLPMRSVSSSHPQWYALTCFHRLYARLADCCSLTYHHLWHRHQGSSAEPATPPRPFRSPAKSYPTPEPSLDPYAGSKGGGGRSFKLGGVPGSVDGDHVSANASSGRESRGVQSAHRQLERHPVHARLLKTFAVIYFVRRGALRHSITHGTLAQETSFCASCAMWISFDHPCTEVACCRRRSGGSGAPGQRCWSPLWDRGCAAGSCA